MKKFVTFIMTFAILFAVAACDSGAAELKKAQETVSTLTTAIKNLDQPTIRKVVTSTIIDDLGEDVPADELDPAYKAIYSKFDLVYESGEIPKGATQATLQYISTWPELDEDTFYSLITDDGTDPVTKIEDVNVVEVPVKVEVVKEGNDWKVLNLEEIMSTGLWW